MPRHSYRRLIVLFALLCQVLTGTLVHVPAVAAATAPFASAETPPCHEHAAGTIHDAAMAAMSDDHSAVPDFTSTLHHCKSGFCTCVCAHAAAALPVTATGPAPVFSHPPLPSSAPTLEAPLCVTPFFRPPI